MTTTPTPKHVFMSYSRRDEAVMRRVAAFLRNQGINIWVDNEKLVPGTPIWEVEIEKAIRSASAVVVILSPDSKNSEWVRREISLADQHRTRIFPILVRGDEDSSITIRLITRQYVDIRKNEDIGLNSLRAALSSYLEELKSQEWNSGEEAERLAREKAQREATEKTTREREEREATNKANREKALKAGELHYKGMLAQKEGNYDEAEYLFRQSLEIAIQLKDEQGKANILNQLAILAQDRLAREKAEREATERTAREKVEREFAEKAAREKTEREATEKAAREKAEREAAEKVARERAAQFEESKREAVKKTAREKAVHETPQKVSYKRVEKAKLATETPFLLSWLGRILLGGILGILLWLFYESFSLPISYIDTVFNFIFVCGLAGLITYPHKLSIVFLILGFFVAGFLSDPYFPKDFIAVGGIIGISAGALFSRILHWIKVLK